MILSRIIPCLLLHNRGLVKTIQFKQPTYVGDPLNAIKIFNEKEVDELIFLDIGASREQRKPLFDLIKTIATECFMPFCYGGGIRTIADIRTIFALGAEKVTINVQAIENPLLIQQAAQEFGSQSIVVAIDVQKNILKQDRVFHHLRRRNINLDPVEFALRMEALGAGELLINSVDRDGTMQGYNVHLIQKVTSRVTIPVIACGGAGTLQHLSDVIKIGGASAAAAGSFFVFHGKHRAVLITYPDVQDIRTILQG